LITQFTIIGRVAGTSIYQNTISLVRTVIYPTAVWDIASRPRPGRVALTKIVSNTLPVTRARVNSFAREITAISAIVAHVAFTELGFYALAVARAVVQYCTCRLTAVRTSKTGIATARYIKRIQRNTYTTTTAICKLGTVG